MILVILITSMLSYVMFKCLYLKFGFDLLLCLCCSYDFCHKLGRLDTTVSMPVVGDFHDNWMSVSIL